jgi:hypothetical protein
MMTRTRIWLLGATVVGTSAGALAAVLLWFVLMRPVALAQVLSGLH